MVKTALSAAKRNWEIHCQRNWMPGIFVVPVNPRRLDVVSTDTRVCYFVMLSFCCYERATDPINFISETAV
jgi:hypothetical protein